MMLKNTVDLGLVVLILLSFISIAGLGWAASWALVKKDKRVSQEAITWIIRLALLLALLWLGILFF